MDYVQRYAQLNRLFKHGQPSFLEETTLDVRFFPFQSPQFVEEEERLILDNSIRENFAFMYPVFLPSGKKKHDQAIVLLHGLNERSWDKYLAWAEFLSTNTEKPVILFPLAFHINRSPRSWSNPRNLTQLLDFRRNLYTGARSISFANVALSNRLSENPTRFYLSGRQSLSDLTALFTDIKTGRHPLFAAGTQVNLFAYSIGAFLSQIALMANPQNLFSDTRLFMFCGGSIFSAMNGISRSIMDRAAFNRIYDYYVNIFGREAETGWKRDSAFESFNSMITPDRKQKERKTFFERLGHRISGIVLSKDTVIPYHGVVKAMGEKATKRMQLLDFPFPYTHENPFPVNTRDSSSVNTSFINVFSQAAGFLA